MGWAQWWPERTAIPSWLKAFHFRGLEAFPHEESHVCGDG